MSAPADSQHGKKKIRNKPPKDRSAARKARAAERRKNGINPARTPSQDSANAWRQGISAPTAAAVDHMTVHMQNVVVEQLDKHQTFPPFIITVDRNGDYELESLAADELKTITAEHALETLRERLRNKSAHLLGALLAFPASLPDRSGASAVIAEVEHVDGVCITVIQPYKLKGINGAQRTQLEDAFVEKRETKLL